MNAIILSYLITDCDARVDIGIVLDMSRSIVFDNNENWNRMLNFSVNIIRAFPIGPTLTRVGMVTFSDNGHLEFYLDQYTNFDGVRVSNLSFKSPHSKPWITLPPGAPFTITD